MVTTIISICISAALIVCLFKWYGVIGIVLFTLYVVSAKQRKPETPVKCFLASLEAGIGIVLVAMIVTVFS